MDSTSKRSRYLSGCMAKLASTELKDVERKAMQIGFEGVSAGQLLHDPDDHLHFEGRNLLAIAHVIGKEILERDALVDDRSFLHSPRGIVSPNEAEGDLVGLRSREQEMSC